MFYVSSDIDMDSPLPLPLSELEGASRTHGGIFRGRAYGNELNMADINMAADTLILYPSKIHLYVSDSTNPAD